MCPACTATTAWAIAGATGRGVAYVRVSRAPLGKLEAYKKRMGWQARWVSSYGGDFNYDFHVSFTKGNGSFKAAIDLKP